MFIKTKICAVALAMAATAPAIADDFTYVSGGLLYHNNKATKEKLSRFLNEYKKEDCKKNGVGFYLNGSFGSTDSLFVEGRLHYSALEQQVLLGIGEYYPVAQWANIYALAGIAKKHITLSVSKPLEKLLIGVKDSIQPTIELGAKLRVNDAIGARVSYRYARFGHKYAVSKEKHLHEGHLGGYYQVAENCAVEAGYNFTHFWEDINDHKITAGIRYSF